MKCTLNTPAAAEPNYPLLMFDKLLPTRIVLFRDRRSGTIVAAPSNCHLGLYYDNWDPANFIPFGGTVTLEN